MTSSTPAWLRASAFTAAVAVGLLATPATAWADLVTVTPDSVSPPSSVPPLAYHWPLVLSDLVIDQYRGLGLAFRFNLMGSTIHGEASAPIIVRNGGDAAWVVAGASFRDSTVQMGFGAGYTLSPIEADLVVPGTQTPATTGTLRLKFSPPVVNDYFGSAYNASVSAYDKDGQLLLSASKDIGDSLDPWLVLDAPGIHSFSVRGTFSNTYSAAHPSGPFEGGPPWGIAAVAFERPTELAPEPSSLALAGLGLLGVAGILRKRRRAASPATRAPAACGAPTPS